MRQGQEGLLEATHAPPWRFQLLPTGMDQPGDMLDQLMRDIERGRKRNQQGPSDAGVLSEVTTPTTRGPALSPPTCLTSTFTPSEAG